MANSKYGYVRSFEQPDSLLSNTWIVVRIDGRGFSKLTAKYKFVKPNDRDALDLMNAAAEAVMKELPDLVLAYGNSDEYSFVFHKDCALFERRASKLTTTIVSTFTSYYVFLWPQYFPHKPLTPPLPSFDGRTVCYPSDVNLRDYMSWRQVDCHINNLYNTTFWTLVQQGGMGAREAEQKLSGSVSSDKNEILFKEFGINYNNEPECFKKGTVLYRDFFPTPVVEDPPSPTLEEFPSPPIASPQPRRATSRLSPQPIERKIPYLQPQIESPLEQGPGPTFLSTTSTPSPPPSPSTMLNMPLPNPLRSNPVKPHTSTYTPTSLMPLSPPSTVTSPYDNLSSFYGKQGLPSLTPLPLSPLTLRPSTKPPLSLNPPNPTTRTNFSPTCPPHDFPTAFPISGYTHDTSTSTARLISHSASASASTAGPSRTRLKQRSPSQPHVPTFLTSGHSPPAGPPAIPLRMSSIPMNNKPRKLSLQNQLSMSTLKPATRSLEGKENATSSTQAGGLTTQRKVSPPLCTNKALPTPPIPSEEETHIRERATRNSPPQTWIRHATSTSQEPQRRVSDSDKREGHVWTDTDIVYPSIADLPAPSTKLPTRRAKSHSRLHSAPVSTSTYYPYQASDIRASPVPAPTTTSTDQTTQQPQPTTPLKDSPRSQAVNSKTKTTLDSKASPPSNTNNKGKGKVSQQQTSDWTFNAQHANEGRPVHMSRTQKDKDRKKRSKAKVLIEHVDIIRDEFWEKRPWILSGKTG